MANALAGVVENMGEEFSILRIRVGVLVIDGPMTHFGLPIRPMTRIVKEHRIGPADEDTNQVVGLRSVLENAAESDNPAEFGVGPNP